jgi:hypothetical protein
MQRWLGCCAASATTVVAVQARHALVRRVALPDPRCGATSRTGECTHKLRPIGSGVPSVNFAGRQRPSPRHSSVEDGDGRRAKIVAGYRPRDGRDTSSCALLVARERRARQAQDSYSRRRRSIVCSGVERGEPCWDEGWTFPTDVSRRSWSVGLPNTDPVFGPFQFWRVRVSTMTLLRHVLVVQHDCPCQTRDM